MNQQKLNELAERAWAYQITVYEDNGVRTYGEQEKVFSKQKFAELIVRECVETIRGSMIKHCTGVVLNTDYNLGLSKASTSIKEHFGVEE